MHSRRNQPLLMALYINCGNAAGGAGCALCREATRRAFLSSALAAPLSPQPIAGGGNLYLMPAQFSPNSWGCYVMDIDTQALCAYRYRPTNDGADLQLVAARKISYDRKLTNFNTQAEPAEVKQMVEQALPVFAARRIPSDDQDTGGTPGTAVPDC